LAQPLRCSRGYLFWFLTLSACVGEGSPTAVVPAVQPTVGELLIAEFYYSGAAPDGGADHYFSDQFVELVNAAEVPLDLSGVSIGDAYGAAGAINPGMTPDSYASSNPDEVVLSSVWRIPEGVRLEPGATLVLAHDGTNHRPFSNIDLTGAGFETYVAGSGRDDDHPTVPNLEEVVYNGGFDWLVPVFGASIVVLSADADLGRQQSPAGRLARAPAGAVLDAVEALMDRSSRPFKRLPDSVDSGFAWVSGTYVGESLQRRRAGTGWQDTNDSGADFMVAEPDPGRAPDPDGVFGEAWVELGSGRDGFTPLPSGSGLELVAGPQGGWHVDVAVQFGGFGPEGIRLVYDAVDAQGGSVSFITQALLTEPGLLATDEGWIRVGDRIVLDVAGADDVVGQEVVVRVTAELAGQTWSDERRVVILDEE
jgi:hypothetical protein